jgi:hypothetical protein
VNDMAVCFLCVNVLCVFSFLFEYLVVCCKIACVCSVWIEGFLTDFALSLSP